jgi:hypothetical protein
MSNNIAVSITADVANARANMAQAQASARDLRVELTKLQAEVRNNGASDALSVSILKTSTELVKAESATKLYAREVKAAMPALDGMAHGSAGVTRELMVMGRELARGNFSRMAGSATILAGRMNLLSDALMSTAVTMSPLIALGGILGYIAYQGYEAQKAAEAMAEGFALTGRSAGNSAEQVQGNVEALATMADVSQKTAQSLIEFDSTHAEVNARLANAANQLIPQFTKAWGENGVQELNKFKSELALIENSTVTQAITKFNQLNQSLLNLKPGEAQVIEGMIESGDRIGAVTRILADLAQNGGGHIKSIGEQIKDTQAQLVTAQQKAKDLAVVISLNANPRLLTAIQAEAGRAANDVAFLQQRILGLQLLQANNPEHGESFESAFANSHATLLSLRDSATRAKDAVSDLHREMEQRKAQNPNDKEVVDYYKNQTKIDHDLERREDPGDFKKPRTKKASGESEMSKYENELRESEYRIRSETGNWQRSMAADEEQFWQKKLAAAKQGSKLYGEILAKYQEARASAEREQAEHKRQISDSNISTDLTVQKADIGERRQVVDDNYTKSVDDTKAGSAIGAAERKRDALKALAEEEAEDEITAARAKAKSYGDDVVAQTQAANEIKVINANLRTELAQLDREYTSDHQRELEKRKAADKEAAKEQKEAWKQANNEMLSAESKLVSDMFGRRKTLGQSLIEIARQTVEREIVSDLQYLTEKKLLNAEGLASDQAVAKQGLLVHLLTGNQKKMATQDVSTDIAALDETASAQSVATKIAGNTQEIQADASAGAAAAYKSQAGIPIVGPELGAAEAVAVEAAIMGLASFAVGTNKLPSDMIARVHQGERIVPAADNAKLLELTARGAGNDNGSGMTMHNHFAPTIHAPAGSSLKDMIRNEYSDFVGAIRAAHRAGAFR